VESEYVLYTQMSPKSCSLKTANTLKDELLFSRGIRHITDASQYHMHSKQVPACMSNIA